MIGTIPQFLQGIGAASDRNALQPVLFALGDKLSTRLLVSAALAIKAGGSAVVKGGAAFYASVRGDLVTKAINTDMAALVGTVTNAKFNVFVFFIDATGTLTTVMGTEGATLNAVTFPDFQQGKACIGFIIVNPTGTGNFVGGTTPLDDATVVPNVVYVNTVGGFDPTVLVL